MNESELVLAAAVTGQVEHWRWQAGLAPEAVATALGASVTPGDILHQGILRRAASITVAGLEWPIWALWEQDGSLVLLEIEKPPAAPTAGQAIEAWGEPDARVDYTTGPFPGYEQLAYLSRGFTLFVWGDDETRYLWLYQPMDYDSYVTTLGATTSPTRSRP